MFSWTSSASSSPSPATPRSLTQEAVGNNGGRAAKPPTPPPEAASTRPTLDSALEAASAALTQARDSSASATEDDFELIDWCAADASAAALAATSAEPSTDARIVALTNAVAQLTAVLQAEHGGSAPISPASSAHSGAMPPGAFPESPRTSCQGRPRPASAPSANSHATPEPPAPASAQMDAALRRMDSRLTRLEHLVTHALTALRALYADGTPFVHAITVRDLHAWGTQVTVTSPNTTVAHVKQDLARTYPAWVQGCRLVWAGLVLQDDQYVAAVVPAGGVVILMGPAAAAAGGKVMGKGCHVQGAARTK